MRKFLFILLLSPYICFSQTTIRGKIQSDDGNPIQRVSVTISDLASNEIIEYDISDELGNYTINLKSSNERIKIQVRRLGFLTETRFINNKSQTIDFILKEKITKLEEIVVKSSKPITKRGDTISYNVASFASKEDRTIADVISNLPGVEVLKNGKILYLGKPINKYYIEGLDLLEGRYNLANKNLPYKEVSKVEILENHQPIRLLDSLVFSQQAALNIKLKNSTSFTGQAEVGVGASPLLWENNITPMLFSKSKQMITSYQTNNSGSNISNQLNSLTLDDLLEGYNFQNRKRDWLHIQGLRPPDFSERRWLDNATHLVSLNYLQRTKKDTDLRINVSYLNDYTQQRGFTNTLFFTENDTVRILENNYTQVFNNSLRTNLTLQKNTKASYFKNSLEYQAYWDGERGMINTNGNEIVQGLNNPYFTISNKLKKIFKGANNLFTLNSFVSYNNTPQNLTVNPGQFEDLLNNGNEFLSLQQQLQLKTFFTNNSVSFTKGIKHFTLISKFGFELKSQNLTSELFRDTEILEGEFKNQLDWTNYNVFLNLQTQYRKNNWRFELRTPISFHSIDLEDESLSNEDNLTRIVFEPQLDIASDLTKYWSLSSSLAFKNRFGEINDLHYGYILNNYRNIRRINSIIPQSVSQNYEIAFNYRNTLKSVFGNLTYSYSNSKENLLYENQILPNGAIELQAIEQDNFRKNHMISGKISNYVSKLKSSFILNGSYRQSNFDQILNSDLAGITNENISTSAKTVTDITDWFDIEYEFRWDISKNTIETQKRDPISNQLHTLDLNLFPAKNQFLGIRSEYANNDSFTDRNHYFFMDLVYRFTSRKKNIDFEFQFNNIFNTKSYRTILIDNFSFIETGFNLRPSQLLFKVRFSL
jgi:hypothetical protein